MKVLHAYNFDLTDKRKIQLFEKGSLRWMRFFHLSEKCVSFSCEKQIRKVQPDRMFCVNCDSELLKEKRIICCGHKRKI